MSFSVGEIAQALGAEIHGDGTLKILRAAEPADAGPDDLAMAMAPKYAASLSKGAARAAVLWQGADWRALGLQAAITVERPRFALSGLTRLMDPGQGRPEGIHPTAVIDPTAVIGPGACIGPMVVIGPRVRIGANAVIGPHCVIGPDAVLGDDAYLRDSVSIGARCRIGARFIAQPGVRIGSDGFSFVTPELSGAEMARKTLGDQGDTAPQSYVRIHSLGAVSIGDDVEIGANSAIDNGTIRDTRIGTGTKLDNLVHVGHNVRIGTDCLLCGQVGISGSVDIGDFVILGGQVGVADNIFIGDRAIMTGATKVVSNVPAGRVMMGYPAVRMDLHTEIYKAQRRLPRLFRDVAALRKAVFKEDPKD
jgi:UDP-3-O-[3-hydroxymyristoyl] glucosamine N-acyltransferase